MQRRLVLNHCSTIGDIRIGLAYGIVNLSEVVQQERRLKVSSVQYGLIRKSFTPLPEPQLPRSSAGIAACVGHDTPVVVASIAIRSSSTP